MNKLSSVSIVMAAYNGGKFITEQIDSILKNTYKDWTLEICDDGSTDKTVEIVEEYVRKYPGKIKLFKNEKNIGVVKNFLNGAKRSKGEYIMFCDQDDVWLPNKIEFTIDQMKKNESRFGKETPLAVFTDAKVVDVRLRILEESFFESASLDVSKIDMPHMLMENKLLGCTVMFNQALLGKFNEIPAFARYHDWWVGLLAAAFGKIIYLNESTLLYRQHGGNVVGNINFFQYVKNRLMDIKEQKRVLQLTKKQAWNFLEIYGRELSEEIKNIVYDFAYLDNYNFFEKRKILLEKKYLKTGIIRNIGVLLLI